MFIRLAAILIGTVALTAIAYRLYVVLAVPYLRQRHVERMRRENDDLDRIINDNNRRS